MELSVVHGIVKAHGGAIGIESEPGRGSTVQIYFPAVLADAADASPIEGGACSRQGQHIMYIDDEKSVGSAMKRVLELLGYRCVLFGPAGCAGCVSQQSRIDSMPSFRT